MNPKLSAWDQVCGVFDYNRTPIGPPGTRVLVHEKSQQRGTWPPHGEDAWYIGPAFEHYRCYKVWAWETRRNRETDTLSWFPHHITMPTPTAIDRIAASLHDLETALLHPSPDSPLALFQSSQVAALQDLLALFTAIVPSSDNDVAPPNDEDTPTDPDTPARPMRHV